MKRLEVNYYALLELDPNLDALDKEDCKRIDARIKECEKDWKAWKSNGDLRANNVRVQVGLAALSQMKADLNASEQLHWPEHARLHKKALMESHVRRRAIANEYCDILDSSTINAKVRDSLVTLLGDAELTASILDKRGLKVVQNTESELEEKSKAPYETVMIAREKLAPLLVQLQSKTVYELISRYSGTPVTQENSHAEVHRALTTAMGQNNSKLHSKLDRTDLFSEVFALAVVIFDPLKADASTKNLKRLYDRLLGFDGAAHIEAFIRTTLPELAPVSQAQFDRLVKLGQDNTGLEESIVREHFATLCKLKSIKISAAQGEPPMGCVVCAYCATLNDGNAKVCSVCRQALFEDCFNCNTAYLATRRRCPSCHITDIASASARSLAAQAQALIASADFVGALSALTEIREAAPRSRVLAELTASVEREQRSWRQRIGELDRLVVERRMHAALKLLAEMPSQFDAAEAARRKKIILEAIAVADALTLEARSTGPDASQRAFELLGRALGQVTDHAPALAAVSRVAPPAPRGLTATASSTQVQLAWQADAMPDWAAFGFTVVRAQGHPPASRHDGTVLGETTHAAWTDATCPHGEALHYAVWSARSGAQSSAAARAGPIHILSPVHDVIVAQVDDSLRFRWSTSTKAQDTAIYRVAIGCDLQAALAGPPLAVARSEWTDSAPSAGQPLRYAFVARYASPGTAPLAAKPLLRDAAATPAPTCITQIALAGTTQLTWGPRLSAGESDEVHVNVDALSHANPNEVLSAEALPQPLLVLKSSAPGSSNLSLYGEFWLAVIRKRGNLVRASRPLKARLLPPVDDVLLVAVNAGLEASWAWPPGCTQARVRFFAGSSALGTFQVRRSAEPRGRCLLADPPIDVVETNVCGLSEDGSLQSEARAQKLRMRAKNTLTFRVAAASNGSAQRWFKPRGVNSLGSNVVLHIELEEAEPMPAFEVRFSPDFLPRASDGRRLKMNERTADSTSSMTIELGTLVDGQHGFVNVCLLDPAEAVRFTVVPIESRF